MNTIINRVFEFWDAEVRRGLHFSPPAIRVFRFNVERPDVLVGYTSGDLDMGRISDDGFDLRTLVRPPTFMPATASLGGALKQMQTP